jgi:hypothetical protein
MARKYLKMERAELDQINLVLWRLLSVESFLVAYSSVKGLVEDFRFLAVAIG